MAGTDKSYESQCYCCCTYFIARSGRGQLLYLFVSKINVGRPDQLERTGDKIDDQVMNRAELIRADTDQGGTILDGGPSLLRLPFEIVATRVRSCLLQNPAL